MYKSTLDVVIIPNFIQTIKNLYNQAETRIGINGIQSDPFEVKRGVRQGDPMSCILYNIAIEPLAIMLRESELKGISVKGTTERIIASLFADDTMIYLHEDDNIETLMNILNTFCTASTAKFNVEKQNTYQWEQKTSDKK